MKANLWTKCHVCCKDIIPGHKARILRLKGERFTRWAHCQCKRTPQEAKAR
jgi:hypothetical protein